MQNNLSMYMCLHLVMGLGQVRKKGCQRPCGIMKSMVRKARFLSTMENYVSKPKQRQRTVNDFVVNKDKQENQKKNEKNYKRRSQKDRCSGNFCVLFIVFCFISPRQADLRWWKCLSCTF